MMTTDSPDFPKLGVFSSILRFSIRFRGTIVTLCGLILGFGFYMLPRVALNVFPEFAPPSVVIQTEAPGLAPEQVELLVTNPLERALGGMIGMETMRSRSIQGLSVITLIFQEGKGLYKVRQMVGERLNAASFSLPGGVKRPVIMPLSSATGVILSIGLTSNVRSSMELRTLADWTIKPN